MSLATAASDLESRLTADERNIAALQSAPPGPPQTRSGFRDCIDARDYGVLPDSGKDATVAITSAIQDATKPGNPLEVFLASGDWLTGPLALPPDVYLRGEGFLRYLNRCTRLVAREAPDVGPLLTLDAGLTPGIQWTTAGMRNIGFDVSRSSRFQVDNPPFVVNFAGVSNAGPFENLIVFGNRGTAFFVGPNAKVNNALSENLDFVNCGCYAGYRPDATASPLTQTGHLVHVIGGDRIRFHSGLYAWSGANSANDDITDMAGFYFEPWIWPDGTGINPGGGSGVWGSAVTNCAETVRVGVVDYNGEIYGPQNLTFSDGLTEGYHSIFHFGAGNVKLPGGYWRPQKIIVRGWTVGGNQFKPDTGRQVLADHIQNSSIECTFIRRQVDVVLDTNTEGVCVTAGRSPNGTSYKVLDQSGGKNPPPVYA